MADLKINDTLSILKNDPYISKIIQNNNISDEVISRYLNVFLTAYKSFNICRNCQGIDYCQQKAKGEVYTITYDGTPTNVIRYCKHMAAIKNIENIESKFVYTNMPKSLLKVKLANIECVNEYQEYLLKILNDIADHTRREGIFIVGNYGVGKTYLTAALANTLALNGNSVCFIKTNVFASDMSSLMYSDNFEYEKTIEKIKNAQYVIFDDIGTEPVSEYIRDRLLFGILDHRMENGLCTIFTSNFDIENLEIHYNKLPDENAGRLCERIRSLADEYVLKGVNQRHD